MSRCLESSTHSLVSKWLPPKLLSICLSHPVGVTLKRSIWKHGLHLPQHVTEQQGQFGQAAPERNRHSRLSVVEPDIELGVLGLEMTKEVWKFAITVCAKMTPPHPSIHSASVSHDWWVGQGVVCTKWYQLLAAYKGCACCQPSPSLLPCGQPFS